MRRSTLVAVAGLPTSLMRPVVEKLNKEFRSVRVIASPAIEWTASYSSDYVDRLYARLVESLKRDQSSESREAWAFNLILLYITKGDASERLLFDRLGLESLICPLDVDDVPALPRSSNEANRAVNVIHGEAAEALRHARSLLQVIGEEVANRDNRTCLLLPQRNFGDDFSAIAECVHRATEHRIGVEEFRTQLVAVARGLKKSNRGNFKGRADMVFRAPPKAGLRHGVSPTWTALGHKLSCVVRGRIRFGAPYDPKFHYDCETRHALGREFPSCHGRRTLPRQRSHVNIAPNDNVR